jgi:hypothetical protein
LHSGAAPPAAVAFGASPAAAAPAAGSPAGWDCRKACLALLSCPFSAAWVGTSMPLANRA